MQVFIFYKNIKKIANTIDRKRHNNQINEAEIIMKANIGMTANWKNMNAWKNHSNVKLWDGIQIFWLYKYTKILLKTYGKKYKISIGLRLFKLYIIYNEIKQKYKKPFFVRKPKFINNNFCKQHQQLLLQKDYNYYSKYFKEI